VNSSCPALGEKGNNAAQMKDGSANSGAGSASNPTTAPTGSSTPVTEPTVISTRAPHATAQSKPEMEAASGVHMDGKIGTADLSHAEAENKSVGVAFGFMVPICLVFAVTLWLFYAYRNPHTKSGQLLIQVSPFLRPFMPCSSRILNCYLVPFSQLHAVQAFTPGLSIQSEPLSACYLNLFLSFTKFYWVLQKILK